MKTGPQKYPGASIRYWHQSRWGGDAMESNVGVIHTTEGRTVPSYGGGASAPNFTALPDIPRRRLVWYQHFDFDVSSRALVNRSGGVETNTLNAVQVELVGTCDERHASSWDGKRAGVDYLFWPDAPDWALAELAKFVRWAHDAHGVKLQSTVTWKPYKKGQIGGSYGDNGVRLTGAQWLNYYGWLGHQHVPENAHGDPGDIDFARVLEHARGSADNEEDDMALSDADLDRIADRVWRKDGWEVDWGTESNPAWAAISILRHTAGVTRENRGRIKHMQASLAGLTAAVSELSHALAEHHAEIDPDALVARITGAIEDVTIRLDVDDAA